MTASATSTTLTGTASALLAAIALAAAPASPAAVPPSIDYQAYLTNADGTPIDSDVSIAFALYNVDIGGVPLWTSSQTVTVDQGLFTVALGNPVNPFPAGLFDGPVYLGMFVAGEELLPRRPFSSNAYSFKADDADTVDGVDAAVLDQSSDVSALQTNVGAIAGDVSAVQSGVASNESRITSLEASAGDITGVGAGSGLTGGGPSGNVSLSIAPGGVVGSMLSPGSVGSGAIATAAVDGTKVIDGGLSGADIADGSLGPADLNNFADYSVGGLNVGSAGIDIDSSLDMIIRDNFHGLRWYSADGLEQWASITARATDVAMRDEQRSRDVFRSNANGVGFAGATPSSGYAATMPSLNVTGTTNIGLERVLADYVLDTAVSECHSHGNLPCWYGSTTVSCPVGKRVLGGGTSGVLPRYGAIGQSYPNSTTTWTCATSYDIPGSTRTCYAICGRLE